ncbi:MAG: hypothetical protein ACYC77_07635 [Coriobacteriia bacterium]
MIVGSRRSRRRRRFRVGVALVCAAVLATIGASQLTGWLQWRAFERRVAEMTSAPASGPAREVPLVFAYGGRTHLVSVPVYADDVERGRGLDTSDVFDARGALRARYLRTLVDAASRSRLVRALADEFRVIRLERGLGGDEYLEMIARAVQEIPHGAARADFMMPAEMLAARAGVCSEKSLLLAALLKHEGYDASIIVFDGRKHVAVGVACEGPGYLGTGYTFVETTRGMYVGQVSPEFRSIGPVTDMPQVVSTSDGKRYTSTGEVAAILRTLEVAQRRQAAHAAYAHYARTAGLHRDRYAQRAREFVAAEGVASFIVENSGDRPGVYRALTVTAGDRVLEESSRL